MNKSKMGGFSKLVSFILIAVLLICTVGFAVNGWQSTPNDEPDSGDNGNTTDDADENTDGTTPPSNDQNNGQGQNSTPPADEVEPPAPVFTSKVTGLVITEEQMNATPLGFVVDPSAPIYGISNSDLTFEFPIEDGTTRMLAYTTSPSLLWKIGSLVSTRNFISGMSNFFGGVVISNGNDDVVKYSAWDTSKTDLDISTYNDCYYIENTLYVYTGKDYIDSALSRANTLSKTPYDSAPYLFSESEENLVGTTDAKSVIIPFSSTSETVLYYSEQTEKYLMFKSGNRKVDMLTGKNISFTNIFILFANATTYEKADGTELVMDTMSGGKGYYISCGTLTEMRWSVDENGDLLFTSLSGEKLTVNKGNAYFGYFKASESSKVKFN